MISFVLLHWVAFSLFSGALALFGLYLIPDILDQRRLRPHSPRLPFTPAQVAQMEAELLLSIPELALARERVSYPPATVLTDQFISPGSVYSGVTSPNALEAMSDLNRGFRALALSIGSTVTPIAPQGKILKVVPPLHPCQPPDKSHPRDPNYFELKISSPFGIGSEWQCPCGRKWFVREFATTSRCWEPRTR